MIIIIFYVIIKGSVTDEDEVQQKCSDGKSIIKIILVITLHPNILDYVSDYVVNDVAETEDQEMGSENSHKSDDEGTNIYSLTKLNLFIIIIQQFNYR